MTRIIAGVAKGRRLAVPHAGTRPTSDRAREGLFNTLAATLPLDGARVLDLYAGTGAVGLEALSRGASTAVLVESHGKAAGVLRSNVATVDLPGAEVVVSPVTRYLSGEPAEPFDLIFADPPYDKADAELPAVAERAADGWLAQDGIVVLEMSSRAAGDALSGLTSITWWQQKRYGEALLWYGRRR